MRCNPSCGGVSSNDKARGIHHVLTKKVLDTLVKQEGASVLYSHLGKVFSVDEPFKDETRQAFELLAEYQQKKKILTTTTRRLLGYIRTYEALTYIIKRVNDETHIYLLTEYADEDLNGVTWYVDDPAKVSLYINNKKYPSLVMNLADKTGRKSVSIKWDKLGYPDPKH